MKLTKQQKWALEWFRDNGPASSFRVDGSMPSLRFTKKLQRMGFVEIVGKEPGGVFFACSKFGLSDAGRRALEKEKAGIRLTEAEDIARSIRDKTTDVCIRAIESLYLDSQGLILDADTIDACVSMLRNLKTGRAALSGDVARSPRC